MFLLICVSCHAELLCIPDIKLEALNNLTHLILRERGQQQVSNISRMVIVTCKGVGNNAGLDCLGSSDAVLEMVDVTTIACKALEVVLQVCNGMFDLYSDLREHVVEVSKVSTLVSSNVREWSNCEGRMAISTINPDELTFIKVQARLLQDVAA